MFELAGPVLLEDFHLVEKNAVVSYGSTGRGPGMPPWPRWRFVVLRPSTACSNQGLVPLARSVRLPFLLITC